jgi:hypothetical protein
MSKTDPLPIFYSLNRFVDHEACISAGSVEICRALFVLDVVGEGASSTVKRAVEGKLIHVDLFLFPTLPTYRMFLKIAESMVSRMLSSHA